MDYLIKAIAFTVFFILYIEEASAKINNHKIAKRDSVEDPFIKVMEEHANLIPVERYDSDPILFQVVDSANSHSVYKDPQSEQVFYERNSVDRNKAVVVLTASEDKLQLANSTKRQYIVLRASKLGGTPTKYYPSIAYLLNAEESTPGKVSIAGKNYVIEWSVWHEGVLNGLRYSFNVHVCHYSAMIPCKVDITKIRQDIQANPPSAEDKAKADNAAIVAKPEATQAIFPHSEYYEFFRDLGENKINGRVQLIGMAFDILSTAIDGIGTVWCGLSGLVLGQCHQYDPASNSYTKSQTGTAMQMANGTVLAANAAMGNGILGTIINTALPGNINTPLAIANGAPPPTSLLSVLGKRKKRSYNKKGKVFNRRKRADGTPRIAGWRTQYVKNISPNVTFKEEGDVFYGLGNCPYVKGTTESFNKIATPEEVNTFYLNLLRNGCISRVKNVAPALKSEGILEISGKSIKILPATQLLSQGKLTWIEEQKLCAAFEFHILSKVYQITREKPETLEEPGSPLENKKISTDVKFLLKFTLDFIKEARGTGRNHYIRLLRHVIKILRSVMEKLGEDNRNLESCTGDCSSDKELNLNDKLAIMGTIKYIMHGLSLEINPDEKLGANLKQFLSQHLPAVQQALKESTL